MAAHEIGNFFGVPVVSVDAKRIDLRLDVQENRIAGIRIFGDFMGQRDVADSHRCEHEAGGRVLRAGDLGVGVLDEAGVSSIPTLAIDHINVGPYIRNTMAADKNMNRDGALMDIYRVMRPGEPPTRETADALFYG